MISARDSGNFGTSPTSPANTRLISRYSPWPTAYLRGAIHSYLGQLYLPIERIPQTYRYQPHVIPERMVRGWNQEFVGRQVGLLKIVTGGVPSSENVRLSVLSHASFSIQLHGLQSVVSEPPLSSATDRKPHANIHRIRTS
jgi:hypothetical protein